jgi:Probable zinc-ribbon domain
MVPVHYFDEKRHCRDCGKQFIFFAMEQKHWFEVLGFMLDADAVRCSICRKIRYGQKCKRQQYEELYHISNRTVEENIELANCCMVLIEEGDFLPQKTEFVRMLLNKTPDDCKKKIRMHLNKIRTRLEDFENKQENSQ